MKVILYMATSINGKTTGINDNTDWVEESDVQRMDSLMKKCGVMLMGTGTYYSFGDDLPSEDAWLVVMTNQRALLDTELENIHFTDKKPKEVLEMISKRGFSEVILAGGEKLNASFLKEDLIDEIRIIVKPLVIGTGKSLFGENESIQKFAFSKSELLGNGSIELIFNKKFT